MLYMCPTPIGNLKDVTLRVLDVLRSVDLIACEDTRRTRILLERYDITTRLVSFHDHNEEQRLAALLPLLREGKDVAVVSDAGMPGLSDPGFTLVRACAEEDLEVTVLPGPSSVSTALLLSGLPSDRFAFVGFLARSKSKLLDQLGAFEGTGAAVVFFESPRRLSKTLGAIFERWPGRRLAVCRELTKLHEEMVRGTAAEVLELLPEQVRGEIVVVLEPSPAAGEAGKPTVDSETVRRNLAMLMERGLRVKQAAAIVAELALLPNRTAYELGLDIKKKGKEAKHPARKR